ncbi:MAG: hypothetical protein JHC71_17195, partial [Blastococcus sp.]|nr:hypothetical protein [Blastococcus sp.]
MTQPDAAQSATAADDAPARIAAGYETSGPALVLGSVVHDGTPHPDLQAVLTGLGDDGQADL